MKRPAELDLFSELDEQTEVEKVQWAELKTSTVLSNDSTSLEFTIPKATGRKMIDLKRAQLMVEVILTKANGAADAAPVNNYLHSLFENCIVKLNDNVIYDANKNYNFSAYLLDLIDRSQEQKEGFLTAQGWYNDKARQFDTCAADNTGWLKRKQIAEIANGIQLIGPLHSELFNQERYMLSDVEVGVELTLAKETFVLMANQAGSDKYTIKINDAKLYVPYVQVSEKVLENVNQTLSKQPAIYPIQRVHTKTIPIQPSGTDYTLDISKGRLPKRVIMGLITDKAKAGDYKLNPYNFNTSLKTVFNLNKVELNVDGMPYAKRALLPNFKKDLFGKEFYNLYESLNFLQDGTNAPPIPVEDFKFGYSLFPFNLNPGCLSEPCVFKKEGELTLDLSFEAAPTQTLQAVVMCIYDNEIRLDVNRNVTTDW